MLFTASSGAQANPCSAPANEIVAENCLPGDPPTEWEMSGAGDASIQGFAIETSVDQGEPVMFKVDTAASDFVIHTYREVCPPCPPGRADGSG